MAAVFEVEIVHFVGKAQDLEGLSFCRFHSPFLSHYLCSAFHGFFFFLSFFLCCCHRPGICKLILPFQLPGFCFFELRFWGTCVLITSSGTTFFIPCITFAFPF